jgi:predicted AAA+ superfamily ATPase
VINRPFWIKQIETAWKQRPIVWLSGVRRVGKTSLAGMFQNATYLNCDLPSAMQQLEDPEYFFKAQKKDSVIILDEIHHLKDPSNVLKIAADAFPRLRVLATGSSTLQATRKFRDSLTGRKWTLYLCPILWTECLENFGVHDLDKRMLHGGLPEPLLAETKNPDFFTEWMDSYYARDIAELFGVRDRSGFLNLLKLLLYQSGGLADVTKLASETGMSRPTVKAHMEAMTVAHAIFPVMPFHGGGRREIVRRPKIYAFDTGFVTFVRSWNSLRDEDRGGLWEHLILDTLRAAGLTHNLGYWRDKSDREIDFVLRRERDLVDTLECKMDPSRFNPENLKEFRRLYPKGTNWLVSPRVDSIFTRRFKGMEIRFISPHHILAGRLTQKKDKPR